MSRHFFCGRSVQEPLFITGNGEHDIPFLLKSFSCPLGVFGFPAFRVQIMCRTVLYKAVGPGLRLLDGLPEAS